MRLDTTKFYFAKSIITFSQYLSAYALVTYFTKFILKQHPKAETTDSSCSKLGVNTV